MLLRGNPQTLMLPPSSSGIDRQMRVVLLTSRRMSPSEYVPIENQEVETGITHKFATRQVYITTTSSLPSPVNPSRTLPTPITSLHINNMAPRVFLVTGTSTGFGYHLVRKIISSGDKVVATARNSSKLETPESATSDNYIHVDLDVTNENSIHEAFDKALEKFGRVDVVVNNAGE